MIGARIGIYSGKNTFTGILDEVSQTGYYGYSYRRLTKNFLITDPICRLRRSSDNAEMNFSFSEDSNKLDANSLETGGATNIVTWMGADTIYVVTVYQQGGTNHMTQSTAANQPIFNKTGFYHNSINSGGVSRFLRATTAFYNSSSAYSCNAVSNTVNSAVTAYDSILKSVTPDIVLNNNRIYWRSPTLLETGKTWDAAGQYAWACYYNGTTETINIGTKNYTRTVTKNSSIPDFDWGISEASVSNDCPKYELIFRGAYDSSDVALIQANQKTYYGI